MKQLKIDYVETLPEKQERISLLLKKNQREDLETEFHKMKGTGKTYGLGEISSLGEILEKICMTDEVSLEDTVPVAIKLLGEIYKSQKSGNEFLIEESNDFQLLKVKIRKGK